MKNWWKYLCVLLLFYTVIKGFSGPVPELDILEESIRNLYFHVPMWFAMMLLMFTSMVYSILYLNKSNTENGTEKLSFLTRIITGSSFLSRMMHRVTQFLNQSKEKFDINAAAFAKVGFFFGMLGIITGSVWARATWGAWWVFAEVKLNGAAAALLIYAAYFILRGSFDDEEKKARFSAVYSIFAFVMFMVLINVIPRITNSSLHPGNGGNPGFNSYDLDSDLRLIFYPAVIGWILLSVWISTLIIRIEKIFRKKHGLDLE